MLTAFPVAFWLGGAFWDLVALASPDPLWSRIAAWTLAAGVVMALPAMATGLWDLTRLPEGHRAERLGWWHGSTMAVAWCLVLGSLLCRRDVLAGDAAGGRPALAMALGGAAAALTVLGGWMGGELVFRLGIGVRADEAARDAGTMGPQGGG